MYTQSFLLKAIGNNGTPELINFEIRQCKYVNNIVEQDHRFIKWRIQQGLGAGIEIVHMIKKKQLNTQEQSMFKSFYSLAA
jgi:putative transposase